jgi:hypothetical protein
MDVGAGARVKGNRALRHRLLVIVLPVIAGALLSGCFLTPAVNQGDYRNKAGNSATAMVSIVNSAILAVQLDLEGRSTNAVTNDLVSSSEMDASSVITAFDSRQPPGSGSVKLMERIDSPLETAGTDLTSLRIAVREDDSVAMRSDVRALRGPLSKLTELEDLSS